MPSRSEPPAKADEERCSGEADAKLNLSTIGRASRANRARHQTRAVHMYATTMTIEVKLVVMPAEEEDEGDGEKEDGKADGGSAAGGQEGWLTFFSSVLGGRSGERQIAREDR
ncbi:hypothetical protein CDD80_5885 [Ophiocordyceps camponoti-rufipedis]|uniref:Uncharacterized protein n=1 Tax=Ophiocordyceps camponoti-rufipedis TaxID=2004952 RepID=A0A2C5YSX8_9HYPO|nr:hypothetical protein CDD80_5885 [Ophiocordyceps camponoti-rufipedis]